MEIIIVLISLLFLMLVAYRGYSVILFAPIAALFAVLLIDPFAVGPAFSEIYMKKMVDFVRLYFPVFLLGAIFGKLISMSGFSKAIVAATIKAIDVKHSVLAIVVVCALLTYGGVSVFVVVFAVYPFAAELFKQADIPKKFIPVTIVLGGISFTMDAMPGTPQIQNIIPTSYFGTTTYAAPILGIIGAIIVLVAGMFFINYFVKKSKNNNEGYGSELTDNLDDFPDQKLPNAFIAFIPLFLVGISNFLFTYLIPMIYGNDFYIDMEKFTGLKEGVSVNISQLTSIWAVQAGLLMGILFTLAASYKIILPNFIEGSREAISGSLLAIMNTASEYGFGAIMSILPGFVIAAESMKTISNPLIHEAITITTLAGITGSASGGLSIALASMSDIFIDLANKADIPLEVVHRIASMASGGFDTLPHNGAIITLLTVTGLTHIQAYKYIFGITIIKTLAVFLVIFVYMLTGWV